MDGSELLMHRLLRLIEVVLGQVVPVRGQGRLHQPVRRLLPGREDDLSVGGGCPDQRRRPTPTHRKLGPLRPRQPGEYEAVYQNGAELVRTSGMSSAEISSWRLLIGGVILLAIATWNCELRRLPRTWATTSRVVFTSIMSAVCAITFLEAIER